MHHLSDRAVAQTAETAAAAAVPALENSIDAEQKSAVDDIRLAAAAAYDRHFAERPVWQWPREPQSLTLPEPENDAQRQALTVYLDTPEQGAGNRPGIRFAARTAGARSDAGADSPGPRTVDNAHGRRAARRSCRPRDQQIVPDKRESRERIGFPGVNHRRCT
jgi:hypothetical protein